MNPKPITLRIAALICSVLIAGTYVAYRTFAATGASTPTQPTLFPGSKSAGGGLPADNVLFSGSKSLSIPLPSAGVPQIPTK